MALGADTILSFLAIGFASLTEIQRELLKWRLSDDAKKYYSKKENEDFYKALKKGDTSVIDAIRAEKQQRIDNYLNKIQMRRNARERRKQHEKSSN